MLDAQKFALCFIEWMKEVSGRIKGVIAINGKRLRGASIKDNPIHLINAFAVENGVSLGQYKVRDKSNEITAIPELLKLLSIKGCIVTIDAMGCQKEVAKKIIEAGADYVLGLKGNQGNLLKNVQSYLDDLYEGKLKKVTRDYNELVDKGYGRFERRCCLVTDSTDWLEEKGKWKGLRSIGMIISERTINQITTIEKRYYISSLLNQVLPA